MVQIEHEQNESHKVHMRIFVMIFPLLAGLFIMVGRLSHLQLTVSHHASLIVPASSEFIVEGRRGAIYDRALRPLAMSVESHSLYAIPSMIRDRDSVADALSKIFTIEKEEIVKNLSSSAPLVWIQRRITPKEEEKVRGLNVSGLGFAREWKRFYPKRGLASHTLGSIGDDHQGLEGLELRYEGSLRGKAFSLSETRLNVPAFQRSNVQQEDLLRDGYDLVVTLDEILQHIVERELKAQVEKTEAKRGIAVMMNPSTGEIVALANEPAFNPNSAGKYPDLLKKNKAIVEAFEPGSAFAMIPLAAALQERKVRPDDLIYCENGAMEAGGIMIYDARKYKWLTVKEIVEQSSNIGAMKAGMKLGKEGLYRHLVSFGFGSRTGIDLPEESAGFLQRPEQWINPSLGAIVLGQEISVTALQWITAFSAIANGGMLMQPMIVRSIQDQGRVVKEFSPQPVRRVLSQETSKTMTEILKDAMAYGGAATPLEGYSMAGKGGTARKIDPSTGTYSKTKSIVSFIGYAPAESPKIALLVIIDEPQKGIDSEVAAFPFREMMRQSLRYLKIPVKTTNMWVMNREQVDEPLAVGSFIVESQGSTQAMPASTQGGGWLSKGEDLLETILSLKEHYFKVPSPPPSREARRGRGGS